MTNEKHYNDMKNALDNKGCKIIQITKKSENMHFKHCIRDCATKNKIYSTTRYFWKLKI